MRGGRLGSLILGFVACTVLAGTHANPKIASLKNTAHVSGDVFRLQEACIKNSKKTVHFRTHNPFTETVGSSEFSVLSSTALDKCRVTGR